MAPNKLKRPGRCDEEDAIEAGLEAASEMVSKMPNGQRAWGEKERAIAEMAARTIDEGDVIDRPFYTLLTQSLQPYWQGRIMRRASISVGDGPNGPSVMKFTLTYQGELRADDNYRKKWEIRNQFHPQLEELWRISPTLQQVWRQRSVPPDGWMRPETHHSLDGVLGEEAHWTTGRVEPRIDLCEPLVVAGRSFRPLVQDSYALHCALDIIFLRKEDPGRIYQGGDLDNRLKTLLDALSMPNEQQIVDDDMADPIFCLMENDRLVSSLNVRTQRLLGAQNATKHQVSLIIEVDVRVAQSRLYNQPFLGD